MTATDLRRTATTVPAGQGPGLSAGTPAIWASAIARPVASPSARVGRNGVVELEPGRDLASDETRALLVAWGRLHAIRSVLSPVASALFVWAATYD
jgi:hypothetical protein